MERIIYENMKTQKDLSEPQVLKPEENRRFPEGLSGSANQTRSSWRKKCKEAASLMEYGYPNSVIAARCELSERDVEEIRQICKVFVPQYKNLKRRK